MSKALIFVVTAITATVLASENVSAAGPSFIWAKNNPTETSQYFQISGSSTGIISRICVLVNGSDVDPGRIIDRTVNSWNLSSYWRRNSESSCFYPVSDPGTSLVLSELPTIEVAVLDPRNLPSGQNSFQILLTDINGQTSTSEALVITNLAQQPSMRISGITEGKIFESAGEVVAVDVDVENLFTTIKSWCFQLSNGACVEGMAPESNQLSNQNSVERRFEFDTAALDTSDHTLEISFTDIGKRKVVYGIVRFKVLKTPPHIVEVTTEQGSATWRNKVVPHFVSLTIKESTMPQSVVVKFGLTKSSMKSMKFDEQTYAGNSPFDDVDFSVIRTRFKASNLRASTRYWVKIVVSNASGSTSRYLRIQSRSIPARPSRSNGSEGLSGGRTSGTSSCTLGMNWGTCVGILGFEPRSVDCSGDSRWSILNSNWWIVGIRSGIPVLSKSRGRCA